MNKQQLRENRIDGCMEALEYYACTFLDKGVELSSQQLEDYKEKCNILQCMGEEARKYADTMLNLIK